MRHRLLAVLAVAVAPLGVCGQPPADHPYKSASVGDFATFKMTMKFGGNDITGTITQTVVEKTDKEATVKVTGKMNGMDIPAQTQKVDLTQPFDPLKAGSLPGAGGKADAKIEKLGEGKEKVALGGKSYDTSWTTFKVTTKTPVGDVVADAKAWMGKDIPLGMAKMEMTTMIAGMAMKMQMELTETGNSKK